MKRKRNIAKDSLLGCLISLLYTYEYLERKGSTVEG